MYIIQVIRPKNFATGKIEFVKDTDGGLSQNALEAFKFPDALVCLGLIHKKASEALQKQKRYSKWAIEPIEI